MKAFTLRETNIIKGVAVIFMIVAHLFRVRELYESVGLRFVFVPDAVMNTIGSYVGSLCVPMFAFVSGYGLFLKYRKRALDPADNPYRHTIRDFVKFESKILVFTVPVIAYHLAFAGGWKHYGFHRDIYGGLFRMACDALGFSQAFQLTPLNGTWWYLYLALFFLCFSPLIFFIGEKFSFTFLFLICILMTKQTDLAHFDAHQPWFYLPAFLSGALFAKHELFEKIRQGDLPCLNNRVLRTALVLIAIVFILKTRSHVPFYLYTEFVLCLLPIFTIMFLFEFVNVPFIAPVLANVGKYSLGIYLIHTEFRMFALSHGAIALGAFAIDFALSYLISFALIKGSSAFTAWNRRRKETRARTA